SPLPLAGEAARRAGEGAFRWIESMTAARLRRAPSPAFGTLPRTRGRGQSWSFRHSALFEHRIVHAVEVAIAGQDLPADGGSLAHGQVERDSMRVRLCRQQLAHDRLILRAQQRAGDV